MRLLVAVLAMLVAAAGIGIAVRFYMGRAGEDRLAASERIEIARLRGRLPQNAHLACPPGYCAVAGAAPSPVFDMPVARLRDCWRQMIAGQPRVVAVAADPAADRLVYIQHTPLLRFPDIVTVEFVAVAPDRSSLAVYSRARYGRADFGTNRRRVEAWLAQLAALARR